MSVGGGADSQVDEDQPHHEETEVVRLEDHHHAHPLPTLGLDQTGSVSLANHSNYSTQPWFTATGLIKYIKGSLRF